VETLTANIVRADKLIKVGSNFFKVERQYDDGVVREVGSVFASTLHFNQIERNKSGPFVVHEAHCR
jgi:hypothetical protein